MVAIPRNKCIAVLGKNLGKSELDLYNKDDLTFVQNISLNSDFDKFYQSNDGIVFLGGYKIAYFDINNSRVITIRDDGITAFTACVLDFDIEKKTSTLIENRKDIYPIDLYLSEKNEIVIPVFNIFRVYNLD